MKRQKLLQYYQNRYTNHSDSSVWVTIGLVTIIAIVSVIAIVGIVPIAKDFLQPKPTALEQLKLDRPTSADSRRFATSLPPNPSNPNAKLGLTNNSAELIILDRQSKPTYSITDGNLIKLRIAIEQPAVRAVPINFQLETKTIATCTIAVGQRSCDTKPFLALGWYWSNGKPQPIRQIHVVADKVLSTMAIQIAPRPVVLVHGFLSSASRAWGSYTNSTGFLRSIGLTGYAVGDGQAEGVLQTGDLKFPTKRTNTIAENAQVLQQYIAGIKRLTGAEQVDLVAHSMGGLISRYYIDRLMQERDVAQLLMVATPHGGSACASLPASLGFYMPATLELRPSYMQEIFNQQITHRRGVPFSLFAGNPIVDDFKAPCTGVPSDLFVEQSSVATIGNPLAELPYLHTNMNRSQEIFQKFVEPLLKRQVGEFPNEPDPKPALSASKSAQFTRVFTGHVMPGYRREITVNLDHVTIASFSLFDPTHSLDVVVRGASGKVIPLSADKHGLVTVSDPTSLIYMGYGFKNPKPGPWKITLLSTAKTPLTGADFAIAAKVVGDVVLHTHTDRLSPQIKQSVMISAQLDQAGQPIKMVDIRAVIRHPNGKPETLLLKGETEKQTTWKPSHSGTYGVDVTARGYLLDGTPIERTAFLTFEVQPAADKGWRNLLILLVGTVFGLRWIVIRLRRNKRKQSK